MLKKLIELLVEHIGVPQSFIPFLEPVLESAADSLLAEATVAAEPLVKDLESGTIPSKDKAEQVATTVIADFKAKGESLLPSVAHLAVELALQKVRAAI